MNSATSLRRLRRADSAFGHRVAAAVSWEVLGRFLDRTFTIGRTVILARLLTPVDFGLMALALVVVGLAQSLSTTGFRQALIQRRDDIDEYLDTAWVAGIVRGVVLAALVALMAPLAGGIFGEPRLVPIIRVVAALFLIDALSNIGTVYFRRNLDFRRRFLLQLGETMATFAVGVGVALVTHSVWALVFGVLAGHTARVVLSYWVHSYKPHLRFEWSKAVEMWKFGRWVLTTGVVSEVAREADKLIIGKLLGPASLGIYEVGNRLSRIGSRDVGNVTGEVGFPTFSRLQERASELKGAYLRSVSLISGIVFPIATGFSLLAAPITLVVLGQQWVEVVTVLPPLAIASAVSTSSRPAGVLFMGVGRPAIGAQVALVRGIVIVALLLMVTPRFGIPGAGWAVLGTALMIAPLMAWHVRRLAGAPLVRQLVAIAPGLVLSVPIGLACALALRVLEGHAWAQILVAGAAGGAGYVLVAAALWRFFRTGPFGALKGVVSRGSGATAQLADS